MLPNIYPVPARAQVTPQRFPPSQRVARTSPSPQVPPGCSAVAVVLRITIPDATSPADRMAWRYFP